VPTTNTINIGTVSKTTTTINGTANISSLKTTTLDAVADTAAGTTALKIGSNVLTGDIEIGNAQTTGDIKIGQSDTSGATITVGTSATATTINGTLTSTGLITASGGLTMGGSNHITLTTATGTIPAINQLGYAIVKGPSTATVTNTSTALVFANVISGPNATGTYMATYTVNTTGAWVGATSGYITFSYSQGGTPSVTMLGTPPLLSYSTGLNGVSWVVVVQVTANGPGIGLNAITNAAGISVGVTSSAVYTKIA
jgi:hypothetical protein